MEVGSSLGLPLLSSQSSTWAWQVRRKGNDRAAIAFTFKLVDYWHAVSGVRVSRLLYYTIRASGQARSIGPETKRFKLLVFSGNWK